MQTPPAYWRVREPAADLRVLGGNGGWRGDLRALLPGHRARLRSWRSPTALSRGCRHAPVRAEPPGCRSPPGAEDGTLQRRGTWSDRCRMRPPANSRTCYTPVPRALSAHVPTPDKHRLTVVMGPAGCRWPTLVPLSVLIRPPARRSTVHLPNVTAARFRDNHDDPWGEGHHQTGVQRVCGLPGDAPAAGRGHLGVGFLWGFINRAVSEHASPRG